MSAGAGPIRVHVWSDVACPWCWVGWNRLNQAMRDLGGEYEVHWHAFLLDPQFSEGGEPIDGYYRRRYGSQAAALRQRLHDSGKWDGAHFADWRWRANTRGAHELIALAGRHGASHEASGLMLRKNYEEGANLSKRDELLAAARQLGLPADEVEAWLGSTEAGAAVEEDDREAKEGRGIHSVPAFLVSCGASREVALVGAESVRAFEAAFRKAAHEAEGTPRLGQRQAAAERKRGTASAPAAEE